MVSTATGSPRIANDSVGARLWFTAGHGVPAGAVFRYSHRCSIKPASRYTAKFVGVVGSHSTHVITCVVSLTFVTRKLTLRLSAASFMVADNWMGAGPASVTSRSHALIP